LAASPRPERDGDVQLPLFRASANEDLSSLGVTAFDVGHVRVRTALGSVTYVLPRRFPGDGAPLDSAGRAPLLTDNGTSGCENWEYGDDHRGSSRFVHRGYFFTSGWVFLAAGSFAALYAAFEASSSVMNFPFFVLPKKAPSFW
jgi:hypothetical protein